MAERQQKSNICYHVVTVKIHKKCNMTYHNLNIKDIVNITNKSVS